MSEPANQAPHPPETSTSLTVGAITQSTGVAIGPGAQAIVSIYQTVLSPLLVNLSLLVRPLIEHYASDVFGGRDAELAALDAFLADSEHPFGLLVAPTGLGKTALLIHWIARVQQQLPNWRIIFAPVSIRFQTASEQVVLGLLAHSLAEIHNDLEQYRSYDQSPSGLRALITDYLRRPLPADTQLLVVLDGIDEATGWQVGPLCAVSPQAGLKIMVAARQRANATRDDYQQQLGWTNVPVAQLDLQALDLPSVTALLQQSDPALAADPAFVAQFYRVSAGDPLTSNLLIKALTSGIITPDSLTQRPPGLKAFLKEWWVEPLRKRQEQNALIEELLALCAAAYGPLSTSDLRALAPTVLTKRAKILEAVHDDVVARFIITVGATGTSYVFSHQRLREVFLEDIYDDDERTELQQRLIAYGERWYADCSQPLPDYLRQFWITHLKVANAWERIQQVVTEIVPIADGQHSIQPWQTARYAAEESSSGYLSDLDTLWQHADRQQNYALALRCALIVSSLRSLSGNISLELLVGLVTIGTPEGKWSTAMALEHIAQMPDSWQQAKCLQYLLTARVDLPLERALAVVSTIPDASARISALTSLIPYLPVEQQAAVLPAALETAAQIDDAATRAQALSALVPHLPASLLPAALRTAAQIDEAEYRAFALTTLVPHLPTKQQAGVLKAALEAASQIDDAEYRASALGALAPHLPDDQHAGVLKATLAAASQINNAYNRANVLITLASHLAQHPSLTSHFFPTLHALARRPRADLLSDLTALTPWIIAIAEQQRQPELSAALAQAILDVGRCWP